MSKNIPTAEEYVSKDNSKEVDLRWDYVVEDAMIEFAKLHVKAALEAAAENSKIDGYSNPYPTDVRVKVDKKSILNAYPSSLIQ